MGDTVSANNKKGNELVYAILIPMIGHLRGTIHHKTSTGIILDVGGVGYAVALSSPALSQLPDTGAEVRVWTYLAVRENALDLYGFLEKDERDFFELLVGISGVGPKSALAILSLATVETLQSAISSGDTTYLTKVSGIGKKSAEKIVLELRDKLGSTGEHTQTLKEDAEVLDALVALGYSVREAREAVKKINADPKADVSARVGLALKELGSG